MAQTLILQLSAILVVVGGGLWVMSRMLRIAQRAMEQERRAEHERAQREVEEKLRRSQEILERMAQTELPLGAPKPNTQSAVAWMVAAGGQR